MGWRSPAEEWLGLGPDGGGGRPAGGDAGPGGLALGLMRGVAEGLGLGPWRGWAGSTAELGTTHALALVNAPVGACSSLTR